MVSSKHYKAGIVCLAVVAIALGIGIGIGTKKTDHQNEALSSMKASEVIDVDAAYDIDCENRRLVLIVPGVGDYQVEGTPFNRRRLVRRLGTEADIPPQPENSRPGAGGWYPEVDCKHNKCTSASDKPSGGSSEYSVASSKSSKANGKSNKSSKKSSKTSKSKKKCISKKTKSDKCPSKKTTKSESSMDDIPYGRDLGTEATVSPVFQPFRPEPTQAPTLVDEVDTEPPDTDSPTQSPRATTSPPTKPGSNKPGSGSGTTSKSGKYNKKSKSSKTWGHAPTTCRSASVGTLKPTIDRPIVPAATPFPSFSPTFGSPPLFNTETNAPTAEPPITTTPTVDLPLVPASTSFPITPFPSYSPTYGGSQTGTPPLFNTETSTPTVFVEINTEPPDTDSPTQSPSVKPTTTPPTPVPTPEPTTPAPTTEAPVTPFPTPVPTTSSPTLAPSDKPTTNVPTISPTLAVTDSGTTTVATDVSSPPTNPPRDRFKV